mgnify:CR=1 FL=1
MPVALDSKPPAPGAPSWYIRICNEQNKKRMSFRPQECESRNLLKQQVLPDVGYFCYLGRFLDSHSFARNDMSVGGFVLSTRVLIGTCHGDESSPLHCVIPFNHTGSIRGVPRNGTQAVPYGFAGRFVFSTGVVQKRPFFILCGQNGTTYQNAKIVNCQLSIVNWKKTVNCQLFTVNWLTPAASCKHPPALPGWSRGSWGRGSGRRLRF